MYSDGISQNSTLVERDAAIIAFTCSDSIKTQAPYYCESAVVMRSQVLC